MYRCNLRKYFILKNYYRVFLRRIYSPIVSGLEGSILKKRLLAHGSNELVYQPIFILGIPRSGTTFVYQLVSHLFSTLYIDNFIEKFSSTPVTAFWVRNLIFGEKKHDS